MGILHNQNLTLGFSEPEVTHWESTPHLSSAVNNIVILLGVLTFALQLCLVLFFVLRCWKFDNRVRRTVKHPDAGSKLTALFSLHIDIYNHQNYQKFGVALTSVSAADEDSEPTTNFLFAPSIPWDLVQH